MNREQQFYQDIMAQEFSVGTFYNATRYIMLYVMVSEGKIENKYSLTELVDLIYNAYCNNPEIKIHHPNIEIRKIPLFGKKAIKGDLINSLQEWIKYSKSNILYYDAMSVYLDIEDDGHVASKVKMILDVLFQKNFKTKYNGLFALTAYDVSNDTDMESFGKGKFRDLVLSDMQYCVVCDEYDINALYAVHILPSSLCENESQMRDVNNGILLCKDHAKAYLNGEFYFDERGRACSANNPKEFLGIRLSMAIFKPRKKYIEDYISYLRTIKNKA
jgi:hypothetical protein